MVEKTIQDYYE
jgi:hypothetical protein